MPKRVIARKKAVRSTILVVYYLDPIGSRREYETTLGSYEDTRTEARKILSDGLDIIVPMNGAAVQGTGHDYGNATWSATRLFVPPHRIFAVKIRYTPQPVQPKETVR
jgi:hypothetical protein